ncbi:MAG: hypothetical protein MJ132_04380 [Clostridia bacterium]|nr:hypothetical protein [Clostridia bacterium]
MDEYNAALRKLSILRFSKTTILVKGEGDILGIFVLQNIKVQKQYLAVSLLRFCLFYEISRLFALSSR